MDLKKVEVKTKVLCELDISATAYLVLSLIVQSPRKHTTIHKGERVYYSEIKGKEIAKDLLLNPSSITPRIKELRIKQLIDKTKFGFCVAHYVDDRFKNESDLILDLKLFRFCKTTEQALILCLLREEHKCKSKLNKTSIANKINVSRKTVANAVALFERSGILRVWKNQIVFTDKGAILLNSP